MRTLVEREVEWDDVERAKMQGLAIYESKVCACGLHESIAQTDPDLELELPVCPVCAGLAQQKRVVAADDAKVLRTLGQEPSPEIPRPGDGRTMRLKWKKTDQRQESSTS